MMKARLNINLGISFNGSIFRRMLQETLKISFTLRMIFPYIPFYISKVKWAFIVERLLTELPYIIPTTRSFNTNYTQ